RENQTFFFVTAEALRERRSLTRTFSLPSEGVRAGDFSGLATVYDPLTTNPETGARLPFDGNQIPLTRLDPVALEFLKKVPEPNLNSTEVQNYSATPTSTNDTSQFAVRLDHTVGANDSLYGRFSYADFDTFQPFGSSNLNETLVPG